MENFYSGKGDLPRHIYRRLVHRLVDAGANPQARAKAFDAFEAEATPAAFKGDFLKMKWCVGDLFKGLFGELNAAEDAEQLALKIRDKVRTKNFSVYPFCSDEYGANSAFYRACFGESRTATDIKEDHFFAVGSCFAVNIARHLEGLGANVSAYRRAEDINSVFANAAMLTFSSMEEKAQRDYLTEFFSTMQSTFSMELDVQSLVEREVDTAKAILSDIKSSNVLIFTLGNVIDFFNLHPPAKSEMPTPLTTVPPRFLKAFQTNSADHQLQIASKLLQSGRVELRLGSFAETEEAIKSLIEAASKLNPEARKVITVSPVPLHNIQGMDTGVGNLGPVEADCVSKSTLRAALHQALTTIDDPNVAYFPSYEIVRWVAPCFSNAVFGAEDGSSRHVNSNILSSIYSYFLDNSPDGGK